MNIYVYLYINCVFCFYIVVDVVKFWMVDFFEVKMIFKLIVFF